MGDEAPSSMQEHRDLRIVVAAEIVASPAEIERCIQPTEALRTLHWGRNYLFLSRLGEQLVAVKQFRNEGWRQRWQRRLRGSKAERSWRVANALREAGIATPEPVAWIESVREDGPSFYLCRYLPEALEARFLIRAMNTGEAGERFPQHSPEAFVDAAAALARRLHAAGWWHRDYSAGNLLISGAGAQLELSLLDLNRARRVGRIGWTRRLRELCRLPLHRRLDQDRLLAAYFGRPAGVGERTVYRLYHAAFHGRHRLKNALRRRRGASSIVPRKAYPHLEAAPQGASPRDRIVWDPLSDQPHQHAGSAAKLAVRLADAGDHLRSAAATVSALPRAMRRYRELRRRWPWRCPLAAMGVALRPPSPAEAEVVLRALAGLGVRSLLLRLHPWEEDESAAEGFARRAVAQGFDLVFALPQNRELVADLGRWKAAVQRLVPTFVPYGRTFQVGQAVNRSKWGVWKVGELFDLARIARAEIDRHPGTDLIGPGVIDFEPHATAATLHRDAGSRLFDAAAHLLYVDRRGAPEAAQLGFSTLEKVHLLHAIVETGRNAAPRSWITEVNWPLCEGPHSPAGRSVSVDEETQADYLARYFLVAGTSGVVERIYWWQLVARGYGLMEPRAGDQPRARPAYHAFAGLMRLLAGATFEGTLEAPACCRLYRFTRCGGGEVVAGWSLAEPRVVELPWAPAAVRDRDGGAVDPATRTVASGVRYFCEAEPAPS